MSVTIQVFDPAMCCATGVCGPSIDPKLSRFSADLDWLKTSGVSVERFNLAQQPGDFVKHTSVKQALEEKGEDALPLILIDGQVKSAGLYPSRDQLAEWAGVAKPAPSLFSDAVTELVAISAAIALNNEQAFKAHYDNARRMGVSKEDMLCAVNIAQRVKEAPSAVLSLANRYLRRSSLSVVTEAAEVQANDAEPKCC